MTTIYEPIVPDSAFWPRAGDEGSSIEGVYEQREPERYGEVIVLRTATGVRKVAASDSVKAVFSKLKPGVRYRFTYGGSIRLASGQTVEDVTVDRVRDDRDPPDDPDHDSGRGPGPADRSMSLRRPQSNSYREFCEHTCWACADQEQQNAAEWSEWRELFGDLEALRRAMTRALPFLADEPYWNSCEAHAERSILLPFPQAEWAVRSWLLDAGPADRAAMEEFTRALYRSQIAVLARHADLDRLPPGLRARVAAAGASPERTPS